MARIFGRKSLLRLAACAVSVLATLVVLELAIGASGLVVRDNLQYVPGVGSAYVPHAPYRHTREGFSEGRFNAHGFRDYEHAIEKPPGTYRIAIFGDSFVEALQVDLDESFPALVQRHFDERRPELDVEVLAFGQSGFGTTDALLRYLDSGVDFSPDLVVLAFLTLNDFRDNHPALSPYDVRPFHGLDERGRLQLDLSRLENYEEGQGPMKRAFRALRRRSYLLTLASEQLHLRRRAALYERFHARDGAARGPQSDVQPVSHTEDINVFLDDPPPVWDEAFEITAAILQEFRDQVESRGARFVIVSLSNSRQVHPERRAQLEATYGARFDYDRPDRFVQQTARRLDIPFLKLWPLLLEHHRETGEYLHGFDGQIGGHWNQAGHRVAAEHVFAFVEPFVTGDALARGR